MSSPSRPSRALIVSFLLAAFAFRLFYGLSMPFWLEDERQVYLIGLRRSPVASGRTSAPTSSGPAGSCRGRCRGC
jgi:hypothetical protein